MYGNKVGIVTLPGRFNYGNRLQNYATTWIYRRLGYEPTTLELDDHRFLRKAKRNLIGLLGKPYTPPESRMSDSRLAAFDRFGAMIETKCVHSKRALRRSGYAFFSTGSDQVWNEGIVGHSLEWYYLDFAD